MIRKDRAGLRHEMVEGGGCGWGEEQEEEHSIGTGDGRRDGSL